MTAGWAYLKPPERRGGSWPTTPTTSSLRKGEDENARRPPSTERAAMRLGILDLCSASNGDEQCARGFDLARTRFYMTQHLAADPIISGINPNMKQSGSLLGGWAYHLHGPVWSPC